MVRLSQFLLQQTPSATDLPELPEPKSLGPSIEQFEQAILLGAGALADQLRLLHERLKSHECFMQTLTYDLALGLLNNFQIHYYSYTLLSVHRDSLGSDFALEQMRRSALLMVYLLEAENDSVGRQYVETSLARAQVLLKTITEALKNGPEHPGLIRLKLQVERLIAENPISSGSCPLEVPVKVGGLDFLNDPVRPLLLDLEPASWLALNLQPQDGINFTELRDAAHLCLHASRILLEQAEDFEAITTQEADLINQNFNTLYLWFHQVHQAYGRHLWTKD